ncbi:MAG: iron complex outermembrane receptor protein [Pseudomonadales bacterium]|jgi:iron complex outermembrane receptor protein
MKKHQLKRSAIAIAVAGGLAAMPLQAQMLEEVIVTATKRSVGMQDVPIALSVMSGEKIAEAGIGSLEDMAVFMPNVHIAEGSSSDSLFIRGVGSGVNFGFEQSVGTFIDGVYFGRSQASKTAFLDIERVEVLKGSQSTLFGKNTIAGAISITTAKPTDEFEGSIALSVEPEFGGQTGTLTLSGPITDNFGARLVLQDDSSDGWMDNGFTSEDEVGKDTQVGRIVLVWQPTDDLDIGFKYESGDSETTGANATLSILTPGARAIYGNVDPNINQNSGFGYDKNEATFGAGTPRGGEQFLDSEWDISTLTVEWALGEYTLKSITGYVDYSFDNNRDSDFGPIAGLSRERSEQHKQFTQELLLTSPQSDSFEYLAGLYYQDEELSHERFTDVSLSNLYAAGAGLPAGVAGGFADATGYNTFDQDAETLSAFFQGTLHFSDTLRLIAGIRYSEDEKEFSKTADSQSLFGDRPEGIDLIANGPTNDIISGIYDTEPAQGGLGLSTTHTFVDGKAVVCKAATLVSTNCVESDFDTKRSEEHWTGDITVQWDMSNETMLYAKYGNGYKAGGFDEDNARGNLLTQAYDDEGSESIEFGAKMDLWEGRGRLNIAVFHSEYDDVQVSTFDGSGGFVVGNAAESEVDGIELDGMYAVSDEITIFGGLAFLDAKYKSYEDGACTAPGTIAWAADGADNGAIAPNGEVKARSNCVNDLSGEALQFAADISANFGISYDTEITDSLELGLSADVLYTDDFDTAADGDEALLQEAYTKVNARISLADIDGTWSIALLGKNLTDETTSAWGNDIPLGSFGFDNSYFQIIDAPRSYEIQAVYNF